MPLLFNMVAYVPKASQWRLFSEYSLKIGLWVRSGWKAHTVITMKSESVFQGHEVVLNLWWKNLCFPQQMGSGRGKWFLSCVLPVTNIAWICITNRSIWEWSGSVLLTQITECEGRYQLCFLRCYFSWVRKYSLQQLQGSNTSGEFSCLNWDKAEFE